MFLSPFCVGWSLQKCLLYFSSTFKVYLNKMSNSLNLIALFISMYIGGVQPKG